MPAKNKFRRIAIWHEVYIGNDKSQVREFESWAKKTWDVKVKYLKDVVAYDRDTFGDPIENKAGTNELLFKVHEGDIEKLEKVKKIAGIKWLEEMDRTERRRFPKGELDKYSS